MAAWDRRTPQQLAKAQRAAARSQVVDAVGPFSPWWRERFAALGRTPSSVASLKGIASLPAVGERDVCPDGDPAAAAGLVLQAGESGFALHAEGPTLRRALLRRVLRSRSYGAIVEADTRPTSFVWAGLAMRFPIASTRSDLDLVARAGARMWQVLGLTRADVVVSALDPLPSGAVQALTLGALGAGSPLLAPGPATDDVAAALRLVPATVLVLDSGDAAARLDDLDEAGAALDAITTVLLVGAPSEQERAAVREALVRVGRNSAVVLAGHVPDGHRLMWAECRESAGSTGLHTYPDLELLDAVDPETGHASAAGDGLREVVVTQLGMRGSALLRWRTGDLADGVEAARPCPSCRRTVPRVLGVRRRALVPTLQLRTGERPADLRGVAAALVGRADVGDWRVVLGQSARDGADELLVHVVPRSDADPADVAVAVARDVRHASGLLPTQVVLADAVDLPDGVGRLSRRVLTDALAGGGGGPAD